MKTKISLLFILAFSVLLTCDSDSTSDDSPIEENVLINGVAIIETNNEEIPFIFHHKDGQSASILDNNKDGRYDGIIYKDKEHSAVINFDEETYLPTKVTTIDGETILFNYHSENTLLNIAILREGNIDYVFDIEVDVSAFGQLTSKKAASKLNNKPSTFEAIKKAATIVSLVAGAVACEGAILGTAVSAGVLAPTVLFACGNFAITVATAIIDASEIEVKKNIYENSGLIALGLDIVSCIKELNFENCISAVVESISKLRNVIKNSTSNTTEEDVDTAIGIIEVAEISNTLSLIGDLNFREIKKGTSDERFFSIRNNSNKEVSVSKIDSPEGYLLDWSSGKIPARKSQLISIVFSPLEVGDYKGDIVVNNDLDNENNTIAINGTGVQAVGVMKLIGELSFGTVNVGEIVKKTFVIENNSLNDNITVSNIEVPDGYSVNWNNGEILSAAYKEVEISFSPIEEKEYDGKITIINDIDQVNNTKVISGTGVQAVGIIKLIGDLSFGTVSVGEIVKRTFVIENNSLNKNVTVSNIEVPDGFSLNWNNGEILSGAYKEVEISFSPTEEKDYEGEITIINDIDQVNNAKAISGTGGGLEGEIEINNGEVLGFGDVVINNTLTRVLTIKNPNLNIPINVSSIDLPQGFSANWTNGIIAAEETKEVIVTFSPTEIKTYSGNVIVNNDVDQNNNIVKVIGFVIEVEDKNNIEIVSGNNQIGVLGKKLPESLKIKLTNSIMEPIESRRVQFEILNGEGSLSKGFKRGTQINETTDENGFTEVFWTLGHITSSQTVKVSYGNEYVIFEATTGLPGTWSISGLEGACVNRYRGVDFVFNSDSSISFKNDAEWLNGHLTESEYVFIDNALISISFTLTGLTTNQDSCFYTQEVFISNIQWGFVPLGNSDTQYSSDIVEKNILERGDISTCEALQGCSGPARIYSIDY